MAFVGGVGFSVSLTRYRSFAFLVPIVGLWRRVVGRAVFVSSSRRLVRRWRRRRWMCQRVVCRGHGGDGIACRFFSFLVSGEAMAFRLLVLWRASRFSSRFSSCVLVPFASFLIGVLVSAFRFSSRVCVTCRRVFRVGVVLLRRFCQLVFPCCLVLSRRCCRSIRVRPVVRVG